MTGGGSVWRWMLRSSPPMRIFGAAVLFLAIAQSILLLQAWIAGRQIGILAPAETLSLIAGAVTAGGLSGILFQITDGERQRSLAAAYRTDQLHVEFGTEAMRQHRLVGYEYLQFLQALPRNERDEQIKFLAEYLVGSIHHDLKFPIREGERNSGANAANPRRMDQYVWAIGEILSFYSRVQFHLEEHFKPEKITPKAFTKIVGPFYWSYWSEMGIMDFVEASFVAYKAGAAEYPFYIDPIRALDAQAKSTNAYYDKKHEAKPWIHQRPVGSDAIP